MIPLVCILNVKIQHALMCYYDYDGVIDMSVAVEHSNTNMYRKVGVRIGR